VSSAATYARFELLRTFRTRRFVILAFGFPVVLYFLIAAPNRHEADLGGTGISAPLYFMVGLAAFGTMNAMLSSGARIAGERQSGWNRQLRLTPLTPRQYFRTKVLTGYAMATGTLLLLYICGSILGVRLSAGEWVHMTWLLLVGLVPFAALGVLYGHLLSVDAVGPAMGGTTALLSIVGGVWFPVQNGALHALATLVPSYWLVQASHVALGGTGWSSEGWLVVAAWAVAGAAAARWAYRRDTGRA
jgi:ABC-2 type transport system permease protein